jgi:hypothetical protein
VDRGGIVQFDITIAGVPSGRIIFKLYDGRTPYFLDDLVIAAFIAGPLPLFSGWAHTRAPDLIINAVD